MKNVLPRELEVFATRYSGLYCCRSDDWYRLVQCEGSERHQLPGYEYPAILASTAIALYGGAHRMVEENKNATIVPLHDVLCYALCKADAIEVEGLFP